MLRPPAAMARFIVAPVTELADFSACPRRYHLRHEVGLGEFPLTDDGAPTLTVELPAASLDAAERGTLAHHLLEQVDLATYHHQEGRSRLRDHAAAAGHDPDSPDVVQVVRQVSAFLESPFGQNLRALPSTAVHREVPFALAVGHEGRTRLLIKGQMDLVVTVTDSASAYVSESEPTLLLLDYKLVRALSDRAYRDQLLVYAAAARALWHPARLRVGLIPLADPSPTPRFLDLDDGDLDDTIDRLGALAGALARARQRQRYDGRPLDTCRDLGCGYRIRCHGDV